MGKNISIVGAGYIGSVLISCLGKLGHKVIGVDIDQKKVNCINRGKSPIEEKGLDELTFEQRKKGNIKATINLKKAVKETEICFICVGTPSKKNGDVELKYLIKVCKDLGKILKSCKDKKYLVIRSTIFPGTLEKMQKIVEKYSGKIEGKDFFMLHQPEFMREGSSIKDFFNPSLLVVGSESLYHGEYILEIYKQDYYFGKVVQPNISQMIKYVNNAWHATKISWTNEISSICKKLNISAINLMHLFVQDEQLNISPYYMKPGFSFSGYCLKKDTLALSNVAKNLKLDTPLLNNIVKSNEGHTDRAIELIKSKKKKKLGFFGLSFKPGTDDQRSNEIFKVINHFKKIKSYDIKTWDYYEDYIKEYDGLKMEECLNQDIIIVSARDKELLKIAQNMGFYNDKIVINLQE